MKSKNVISLAIVALSLASFNVHASNMKQMVCESTKKEEDGTPYHKWQAIFDASLFNQGKLEYQLTEWHAKPSKNDGKVMSWPLQVTPTTLKFYEGISVRGKTNWFSTDVSRQTMTYGSKHAPDTQTGSCSISEFKTVI